MILDLITQSCESIAGCHHTKETPSNWGRARGRRLLWKEAGRIEDEEKRRVCSYMKKKQTELEISRDTRKNRQDNEINKHLLSLFFSCNWEISIKPMRGIGIKQKGPSWDWFISYHKPPQVYYPWIDCLVQNSLSFLSKVVFDMTTQYWNQLKQHFYKANNHLSNN